MLQPPLPECVQEKERANVGKYEINMPVLSLAPPEMARYPGADASGAQRAADINIDACRQVEPPKLSYLHLRQRRQIHHQSVGAGSALDPPQGFWL